MLLIVILIVRRVDRGQFWSAVAGIMLRLFVTELVAVKVKHVSTVHRIIGYEHEHL